jgi:hypothetical protein
VTQDNIVKFAEPGAFEAYPCADGRLA